MLFKRLLLSASFICALHSGAAAQTGYDTVRILFPINITRLDKQAQFQLDSLSREIKGRKLLIYGYADYLGHTPANMQLAEGRAQNVAAQLRHAGVSDNDILVVAGAGEVNRAVKNGLEGYPEDRRVFILVRRSDSVPQQSPVAQAQQDPLRTAVSSGQVTTTHAEDKAALPQGNFITAELVDPAQLKEGQSFPIRDLHFVYGQQTLTPDSRPALEELYRAMAGRPELIIRLEGHICCTKQVTKTVEAEGADRYKLSSRRAQSVYEYLVKKGIAPERMSYIGYGGTRPLIADEKTEADAAINRRVEVRIIKND